VASAVPAHASPLPDDCNPKGNAPNDKPLWQQQRLQFKRAWPFSMGQGIKVAVVDTGVSTQNPQLRADSIVTGGVDLVHDNEHHPPYEVDCKLGHGTPVAGIIAARPTSGTHFVGVAPRSQILSVRYASGLEDEAPIARLAKGIRWAVGHGAQVINVSSTATTQYSKLREAIEYAEQQDVVVVAATGNDGAQGNPVTYPAAFPSVIAVGAIDKTGAVVGFSDTAVQASVVAPGQGVVSTLPKTGHKTDNGTSFAAPFVAGAAALVRAAYPDLSATQVRHRIEATADHVGGDLPDPKYGWGVVDPYAAVTTILPEENGEPTRTPEAAGPLPPVHLPPPPDHTARDTALQITGVGFAVVVLLLAGLATFRRGRARGWRPG
ncbi:MAG: type VII secretion-associated serine protease mycosin, partial [Nocardioidaceae bacterium]